MSTTAYQIAVEFERPITEDGGETYKKFLDQVDPVNLGVMMSSSAFVGEYDSKNHAFYNAPSKEAADKLVDKVRNTGLAKDVHIDELP